MAPWFSVFYAFIHHSYEIIDARAVHNNKIFNEKAISWVPTAVQDSRSWVQEIFDLLVVYFCEWSFDWIFLRTSLWKFP